MGVLGKLSPFSRAVAVSRRADAGYPVQITLLIALSMLLLFASLGQAGDLDVINAAAYTGVGGGVGTACAGGPCGLRVTPGSTCAAANDLNIESAAISGTYDACNSITAGVDTANGVKTTGNTTFTAGDEIVLRHRFTVDTGDSFTAIISSPLTQWAYVQDNSPTGEKTYNASFYLKVNNLAFDNTTDRLHHFVGYSSDGTPRFRAVLRKHSNGEKRLIIEARKDNGSWESTDGINEAPLPDGYNKIEINWSAGSGSGSFQVAVNDGEPFVLSTNLVNDGAQIDQVKWGAIGGTISAVTGTLDVDEFSSWR